MAIPRSVRDTNGLGLSGYVQSWLSSWGFVDNPFGRWEASREPRLGEYFIRPPFFEQLLASPRSTLVFAPRGGGKSATRIMIQAECRPRVPDSDVFAVPLTDFSPLVEPYGRVPDLALRDYVPHLIYCALPGLLAGVALSAPVGAASTDVEIGRLRYWFEHYSPPSHDTHQLTTALAAIGPELDQRQRASLSAQILDRDPLPAGTRGSLARLAWLWGRLRAVDVVAPAGRMDLPSRLMETFVRSALGLLYGVDARCTFCLLVDGVDECAETQDDPEATARLLRPLIANPPFYEMEQFVAKFFLPEEQRAAIERIARTNDRLEALTLTWGGPQPEAAEVLRELLRRRIATFNARGMRGLGELCAGPLRRTIEDEMLEVAGASPRNLMRLGDMLIREHCLRNPNADSVITLQEWQYVQAHYTAHEPAPQPSVPSQPAAPPAPRGEPGGAPVPALRIDLSSGELRIGANPGPVPSDLEFRLLTYLYRHKGEICSKAEVAIAIYGSERGETGDELVLMYGDALNQLVRRLRRRIEPQPGKPAYVQTIKGRGYRLDHAE